MNNNANTHKAEGKLVIKVKQGETNADVPKQRTVRQHEARHQTIEVFRFIERERLWRFDRHSLLLLEFALQLLQQHSRYWPTDDQFSKDEFSVRSLRQQRRLTLCCVRVLLAVQH
jgi:hypothetical protein